MLQTWTNILEKYNLDGRRHTPKGKLTVENWCRELYQLKQPPLEASNEKEQDVLVPPWR